MSSNRELKRLILLMLEKIQPFCKDSSREMKGLDYRKVGSSWLTKENTKIETGNVLRYVDAVVNAEDIPNHVKVGWVLVDG